MLTKNELLARVTIKLVYGRYRAYMPDGADRPLRGDTLEQAQEDLWEKYVSRPAIIDPL